VVAVPYGLDKRFLADADGAADASSGGLILFPGAPVGRKNLDAVLECMASAAPTSALSRARLEISGATLAQFPHYEATIKSLGLQSRVRWLGQVPPEELLEAIRRATVVAYPSLYEGFGFPPLEAMALGTPVVSSTRGSLPEVLGDGALLVDPTDRTALGEALEAVLGRTDVRERLRRQGRARARTFTWERCAERTLEVYRDVLAELKGVAA
jgi:glycosyltransferase involved in cell wall biosynthesis